MIGSALEELDLTAAIAAFRDQEETHGHTASSDAERPIGSFADTANRLAGELRDVLNPGDRQNLKVAYRRSARLAAFSLAMMRRIRLEERLAGGACNTEGNDR